MLGPTPHCGWAVKPEITTGCSISVTAAVIVPVNNHCITEKKEKKHCDHACQPPQTFTCMMSL